MKVSNVATKKKTSIDKKSILISVLGLSIIIGYVLINPKEGMNLFVDVRNTINAKLGVLFLWTGFLSVILCGYLIFSKFGKVKLGAEKPEFSKFTWCAMMFCGAMGASLQFWSVIEWSYYYADAPLGIESYTSKAAEAGLGYALFHWGLTPWAFYAVGTVSMAYLYYVKKRPGLRCSNVLLGVFGEKHTNGLLGKIVDISFIFTVVIGLACTFGTGVYMVSDGWAQILNIQNTIVLTIIIVSIISLVFITSSYLGLDKGLSKIADVNTYYAILFVVVLFIIGPTTFILNNTTNSIGFMVNNFVEMSLWTDPIDQKGFPEAWTMFYWGFWLGTAPFFWIFATKISRGRTIKELVSWMLLAGITGTLLYFGVISNYAISYQLDGTYNMVESVATLGADNAISTFLTMVPGGLFILISWTIVASLFLATSMDSGAFALASNTQRNLKLGESPAKGLRLFWCIVLTGLPIGFIMSGAPIEAFKASANISGTPILLVYLFAIISLFKWFKEDYGKKSAHEIEVEFREPNVLIDVGVRNVQEEVAAAREEDKI
ncbi:choline transporter [Sporosarcina sp. P13]|uniref:BCCT family transporter n=1 Tax=Sporosarcina sp. P13 TaxID=2048263 RepID=UPI000C164D80|nr:BCCT family transporter [Sporosarcina sp. P13]PIC63474.1 choline transporter [Sporosarcina sp. P13]